MATEQKHDPQLALLTAANNAIVQQASFYGEACSQLAARAQAAESALAAGVYPGGDSTLQVMIDKLVAPMREQNAELGEQNVELERKNRELEGMDIVLRARVAKLELALHAGADAIGRFVENWTTPDAVGELQDIAIAMREQADRQ